MRISSHSADAFDQHADQYDRWFDENKRVYEAEVAALRRFVPDTGLGVDVGAGTGRFSVPFGISIGVEPARRMAQIARARNVSVCRAVGERLPFRDGQFDFALLVTVVCFVDSVPQLLEEVARILRTGGRMILGFIDRETLLGRLYQSRKDTDTFYREAHFYSAPEITACVREAGFGNLQFAQTVFGDPGDGVVGCQVRDGYGEGAFVAVSAQNSGRSSAGKSPIAALSAE